MEKRITYPWETPAASPPQAPQPPAAPSAPPALSAPSALSPLPAPPAAPPPDVPQAPGYVLAHAFQEHQVTLLWGSVPGADGYLIHRGEDPRSLKPIAAVEETSYIDSQTRPGTTYYYTLRSYNEQGQSGSTPTAAVTLPAEDSPALAEQAPAAPQPAPLSGKRLKVRRTSLEKQRPAPCAAPDRSVPAGPSYTPASCAAPAQLRAYVQGTRLILLQWQAPAACTGLTYRLYRSETPWCCYSLVAETAETEFLDNVPEAATKYYYFVQAVQDGRASQASPMAEALTYPALPQPETPIHLRANPQGLDAIELRWNHARGAAAYAVYARLDPNEEFRIIGHSLDNGYLHEELPPEAFVDYRVQSYHDSGASELSAICTGRVGTARPAPRNTAQAGRAAPRFPAFSLQGFRGQN